MSYETDKQKIQKLKNQQGQNTIQKNIENQNNNRIDKRRLKNNKTKQDFTKQRNFGKGFQNLSDDDISAQYLYHIEEFNRFDIRFLPYIQTEVIFSGIFKNEETDTFKNGNLGTVVYYEVEDISSSEYFKNIKVHVLGQLEEDHDNIKQAKLLFKVISTRQYV